MTALATIADQSSVADGVRGWVFVAAVIVIGGTVTAVLAARWNLGNVPVMGDELSTLDRLDRVVRVCTSAGPRGSHAYSGQGSAWVCRKCGDTVERDGGAA